jgi:predicted nuclease of restriction endonuclease-like (RecB) superfamily
MRRRLIAPTACAQSPVALDPVSIKVSGPQSVRRSSAGPGIRLRTRHPPRLDRSGVRCRAFQISSSTRTRRDILGDARAEYGNQIVSTLSRQLTAEYGAGFSRQNLFHMIRFVEAWPEQAQTSVLAQHLGWSHFKEILYLENELARQFYAEMCRLERWSVRTLRDRGRSMIFERTAVSRLPEATIREDLQQLREADRLTPELVFRDPYLLDFLGLKDAFSERDLEAAILQELERFLLELGTDFAFLARQKRMTIVSVTRVFTSICCSTTGGSPTPDRDRSQTWPLRSGLQRADGTLPSVARSE